jgi:hypothetical protein
MIVMMIVVAFVSLELSIGEIMLLIPIIQGSLDRLIRNSHHLEAKIQVIME